MDENSDFLDVQTIPGFPDVSGVPNVPFRVLDRSYFNLIFLDDILIKKL